MTWRAALAGGLTVAAIVVIGVAIVGSPGSSTPATPSTTVSATPSAAPTPCVPAPGPGPLPVSVIIPAIHVASPTLVPLCLNPDHTVQVPDIAHPEVAGWYALDARPGDPGAAVLLGHVDGDGSLGVFHDIGALKAGDTIKVGRADGSAVVFTVTKVETVLKKDFPSTAVYGPTPDPELRLVSCGGAFDKQAGSYDANVLVFAKLTG